jgi:hypothetical protein
MKMKKDLDKVKAKLIELGFLDNEYLDKYIEVLEANLETKRNRKSTQAHHAIPVNTYWTSNEPYKRTEALKLAKADPINFEVHLLYKDHVIIHSLLTLCTNLDKLQEKYESQTDLRKRNSQIGVAATNQKKKTKQSVIVAHKKSLTNLKQFYSDEEIDDILNL